MGLRDEILKEQNLKEQESNAKLEAEKAAKLKELETQKKAQEAARKKELLSLTEQKAAFAQLKKDLKTGNVPKEWVALYDEYLEKLKVKLTDFNEKTFDFKLDATKELYEEYFYEGAAERYSPGILLNQYMAKRLKDEGFYSVTFSLERYYTYYSTKQDEINYENATKDFNRRHSEAMREYERAYAEWSAKNAVYRDCQSTGGINNPSHPGTPPRYPMMYPPRKAQSGKTPHYCVSAKASLLNEKEVKKREKKENKGKKVKREIHIHPIFVGLIILGSIWLTEFLVVLCIPAWREHLFGLFINYPLTDLTNWGQYNTYWTVFGYSSIPAVMYYFFKLCGVLIDRFF